MDRITETTNLVKELYQYKLSGNPASFIKHVCRYFDSVKNTALTTDDANFLLFLANKAGVPHYYSLLESKYYKPDETMETEINLLTLSAIIHSGSLVVNGTMLHRYQKEVLDKFIPSVRNRFVLTAPTSFGKTYIVYEVILKMNYRNILLIFPSISLLSENYSKLRKLDRYNKYSIHTLSEEPYDIEDMNIFIFTPERYLSFLSKNKDMHFDFAFVDEVYKIDNTFIIDQETTGENERDVAYRLALEFICNSSNDMMLAGPYMALPEQSLVGIASFLNFAHENQFKFLIYNEIEIVDKTYEQLKSKKIYSIDGKTIHIGNLRKAEKISNIITALSTSSENTIIYCGRRSSTESYTKVILENTRAIRQIEQQCKDKINSVYNDFIHHLEHYFGTDWIVVTALKKHIGIHHSLIPKYIQKEIIDLFNQGTLLALFTTTTITEGVNTTAKNMIVTSSQKGEKALKQFDAKNIAGRAGRFMEHYVGRVVSIDRDFFDIMNGDEDILNHKNYDKQSEKTDIDYQITKEKYLSENDLREKQNIDVLIQQFGIPSHIFNAFRIVGPKDKLKLYERILDISDDIGLIQGLAQSLVRNQASKLHWDGFQLILDIIRPLVKEPKLVELIDIRIGKKQISLITILLSSFLENGYIGMVKYYVEVKEPPLNKDEAIRKVSDYVYNVFKYHLVKYLGLFDIFYRYIISKRTGSDVDDIAGIGILLQKLEYNALSTNARRLSDFGVPFRLVSYYDDSSKDKRKRFDSYEQYIDGKIQSLLEE